MKTNIPVKSIAILGILLIAIWIPFGYNFITLTNALIITVSMIIGGVAGYYTLRKAHNNK